MVLTNFPGFAAICSGGLSVRRMKAERELGIPIDRRTGFAISVKDGKPASELDERSWEESFESLCQELKKFYPELYERLFGSEQSHADSSPPSV